MIYSESCALGDLKCLHIVFKLTERDGEEDQTEADDAAGLSGAYGF